VGIKLAPHAWLWSAHLNLECPNVVAFIVERSEPGDNLISQCLQRTSSTLGFNTDSWDRCYAFKNIFAEKFGEKIGVFIRNKA
jgi:hypothetical protein